MDSFPAKRQSTKHRSNRLTQEQLNILERNFTSDKKLNPERKLQLATELGVPPRQVAIWYQNRRARWRTQTLEFDYNALQVQLDASLAEKKVLEMDLERARDELRSAEQVLALANLAMPICNNLVPKETVSGSCEEGGESSNNSSFNGGLDACLCWEDENNKALQLDHLYACVMFSNGSDCLD